MSLRVKRRKPQFLRIFAVLIAVVILAGFGSVQYYQSKIGPIQSQSELVEFKIENGSTVNQVLDNLEAQKMIPSSMIGKLYTRLNKIDPIRAGTYQIDKSWSLAEILSFVAGNNAVVNQVLVTIPEGTWAKNIAVKIAEQTNVTAEELLALWSDKVFLDEMIATYDFLTEDIYRKELFIPLEGFLYPETYYFYANTTARDVTIKMLDQTKKILAQFESEIKESSFSIFELMTMASLVQFEANNPTDMKMVAGIFFKRLSISMPIQASATVCYALYDDYKSWQDCEYNIDIKSPYNTYYVNALPIGPISNPGLDALEATFHPTKSDYLYFISDVKGDRKNYYAKTYAEHLQNIEKYAKYLK